MSNRTFVLDLGSSKVACLVAERDDDRLKLVDAAAVGSRGMYRGEIVDEDALTKCIQVALTRIDTDLVGSGDVIVNIGSTKMKSQTARGIRPVYPPDKVIQQEDVLQVATHSRQIQLPSDEDTIQALPREYVLDGSEVVSDPIGKRASRLEVRTHVTTCPRTDLDALSRVVEAAGLKLGPILPSGIASGLAAGRSSSSNDSFIVVDIGAGTTDIAVFIRGASAFAASLAVSSEHITNDVAALLKISKEDAESLKLSAGNADPKEIGQDDVVSVKQVGEESARPFQRKVLCEIIESRVREIAQLVKNRLEDSELADQLPKSVLLTGGGSHLPGVGAVFGTVFEGCRCSTATPRIGGINSRQVAVPEMATLVGLAEYGLDGEDELVPASGAASWKDRIRSLRLRIGSR